MTKIIKTKDRSNLLCNHLSRLLSGLISQGTINTFSNIIDRLDYHRGLEFTREFSKVMVKYAVSYKDAYKSLHTFWVEVQSEMSDLLYKQASPFVREISIALDRKEKNTDKDYILSGLMNLHSIFMPENKPTRTERLAIKSHIQGDSTPVPQDLIEEFRFVCKNFTQYLLGYRAKFKVEIQPLTSFPIMEKKAFDPVVGKSTERKDPNHYDLRKILTDKRIMTLFDIHPKLFIYYTFGVWPDMAKLIDQFWDKAIDYPHNGKISLLSSPKGKFRPVAVPSLVLLSLNFPLSRTLQQVGTTLANHGMFDHDKAAKNVQLRIDGKTNVYSVDYSSFTDHFPYLYQKVLLDELRQEGFVVEYDITIQDLICSIPYKFGKETVHYSRGTPQGTYASFPLASICHMLTGHMAHYRITKRFDFGSEMPMIVVGDDAVIFGDRMFTEVSYIMERLNVPIQYEKTLKSRHCAEFCSKFITKDKVYLMKKIKYVETGDAMKWELLYYDGNFRVPKKYKYILQRRQPYGINRPDKEDLIAEQFDLRALIATERKEIKSLYDRDNFRIYIERSLLFKDCFKELQFSATNEEVKTLFNSLAMFPYASQLRDYSFVTRQYLDTALIEINHQIKSGTIRFSPSLTKDGLTSHLISRGDSKGKDPSGYPVRSPEIVLTKSKESQFHFRKSSNRLNEKEDEEIDTDFD